LTVQAVSSIREITNERIVFIVVKK